MQKSVLAILPFLLLFSCTSKTEQQLTERVVGLHMQADTSALKNRLGYLLQVRSILETHPKLDDSLRLKNYAHIGRYYRSNGILDSAAINYFRATNLIDKIIKTDFDHAVIDESWTTFRDLKQFGDCLALAQKHFSLIDKNDSEALKQSYFLLENSYQFAGQYDSAQYYNKLWINELNKDPDVKELTPAYISKAFYTYYIEKDPKKTFDIFNDLIAKDSLLTPNLKRQLYGNHGVYLYYENRKEEALNSYVKGLNAFKESPDTPDKKTLMAYPYANISEVLIDLGRFDEAEKYLDSATSLGFDNISQNVQYSLLKYRFRLNEESGAPSTQIVGILDSIVSSADRQYQEKFSSELVALTQANKNQQDLLARNNAIAIKNLKLQTRLLIAVVVIILSFGIGFWFYRNRKLKFERTQMQMQQRLLRTQMNPHYTSNSLYAIGRLVKKSPQEAASLLTKFSRQLRQVMENSLKNKVLFEDEMAALKGYLELQKMRLPGGLEYSISYENFEEDDPLYIPPMLIQPFVENAIEHGFKDIDYLGRITLRITQQAKTLQCVIEDNGKGLATGKFAGRKNSSTTLISEFLKKTTKSEVSIVNKTDTNQTGIIVTIHIPYSITDDH